MTIAPNLGEQGAVCNLGSPAPFVPPAPTAAGPHSERDLARQFLLDNAPFTDQTAWDFVTLPFVARTLDVAVRSLVRDTSDRLDLEDVRAAAQLELRDALCAGLKYADRSVGGFGGWLFAVCARRALAARTAELKKQDDGRRAVQAAKTGKLLVRPEGLSMGDEDSVEAVRTAIERLPDQERRVVLDWLAGVPAQDTAAHWGVTPARISQIRKNALTLLRAALGDFKFDLP